MARVIVIGGVAAGTSAAAQAKRREPSTEVVLLERDPDISYGACGMPYNLADPARELSDLVSVTVQEFREERRVDIRTEHDVLAIDPLTKGVLVRDIRAQQSYELSYDKLILATGAEAVRPKLLGSDLPNVFTLRTLQHGGALKSALAARAGQRALVVGGGYVGLEMVEALVARGFAVHVVEHAAQLLPGYEPEIAALALAELHDKSVSVEVGSELQAINLGPSAELVAHLSSGPRAFDLILIAVGVKPNVRLARGAGIELGPSGAIAVDAQMRTSASDVFAAGDCAEAYHLVAKQNTWVPLGTTANKQGKVAGANAVGANEQFRGIVGSAAFKLFDLEVARTGLSAQEAGALELPVVRAVSKQADHAKSFSPSRDITTILFAERGSERLLGAQMIGHGVVAKRIDVLATALHAGMCIRDLESLDLSYAPPFAPVYDPVLIAATVLRKELARQG